jgi:hypothetical protein
MAHKAVFCIAKSPLVAQSVVEAARTAGFSRDDISVLFPDTSGTRDFAHEQHTKAPEGAATGAVTGGALGAVAGWLVGIGAVAIAPLGAFIAAGPIMAMLAGAAAGATAGGVTGMLVGYGMPEFEAKRYEGKVKNGGVLISVHTDDREQARRAKELFERCGAEDVSYTGESKAA